MYTDVNNLNCGKSCNKVDQSLMARMMASSDCSFLWDWASFSLLTYTSAADTLKCFVLWHCWLNPAQHTFIQPAGTCT